MFKQRRIWPTKAQIISSEGSRESDRVTKDKRPEIGEESIIESSSREEATKSTDKPTQSKK